MSNPPSGNPISKPAGTVTFLFTDIQGSTAMWERDAKRMQLALARHDEIMKTTVSSHGGHVFKMIGDACCAAFPSAPNALEAVLYEMLTGALPYDAETPVGVVMQHVGGLARSPKDANPDVPEELDSLVSRLLARNPEERQADAATVAEELEGIIPVLPEVPQFDRTRGARTAEGRGNRTTRPGTSGRRRGTGSGRRMGASVGGGFGSRRQRVGVLVAMGLVLVSIGVIAFVALGQGGGLPAESRTLPEVNPSQLTSEALAPGRYTTKEFDPTLSFTVAEGAGWRMAVPDSPVILEITPAESLEEIYPALTFLSTQGGRSTCPTASTL